MESIPVPSTCVPVTKRPEIQAIPGIEIQVIAQLLPNEAISFNSAQKQPNQKS